MNYTDRKVAEKCTYPNCDEPPLLDNCATQKGESYMKAGCDGKLQPWLSMDHVDIGDLRFSIGAQQPAHEPDELVLSTAAEVEYVVARYKVGDDRSVDDPTEEVYPCREDFLAMLSFARTRAE